MIEAPEPLYQRALALLACHYGHDDFRPQQRPVIRAALAGRDILAVLPTGAGKSVCFQVPALALGGLTLVVSPLIALMQDQVAGLTRRGIPAAALHGANSERERESTWAALAAGQLRLLYLSPEGAPGVISRLRRHGLAPDRMAVDEAHCIVEWGHDFRPAYRALGALRREFGYPPTTALTGSATPDARREIIAGLGLRDCRTHIGSFDRPNLRFEVIRAPDLASRRSVLVKLLRERNGLALVYVSTRSLAEAVARVAMEHGHVAWPYHAGLDQATRRAVLARFLEGKVGVLAATSAFGMGIDKPDVRLVVHWTIPPSPEAYYQEAGRAGRDGNPSRCVLLWSPEDARLHRGQLDVTFPDERLLRRLWSDPKVKRGIPANVLESAERLAAELHPERGTPDFSRVRLRRRAAEERLEAMVRYAEGRGCRRSALVGYFGERLRRCSGCDRCRPAGDAQLAGAIR
jgi:ATP-dependent DNA helicase RecQ